MFVGRGISSVDEGMKVSEVEYTWRGSGESGMFGRLLLLAKQRSKASFRDLFGSVPTVVICSS